MARGRLTGVVHPKHHTPDVIAVKGNPLDQGPLEVRAARISAEYREEKERPAEMAKIDYRDHVGPVKSLREHILRLSLFPNIFNRSTVKASD